MKKGFTLMEILAVLLIIAVVVSMAVPVFRSVRYDIKNSQAKKAAKALAEAMRTYYQVSRGLGVQATCFTPTTDTSIVMADSSECISPSAEGIPYQQNATISNSSRSPVSQLFACGYLSYKDFANSPYQFCTCPTSGGCTVPGVTATTGHILAVARGTANSGPRYPLDYFIYVDRSMVVKDTDE